MSVTDLLSYSKKRSWPASVRKVISKKIIDLFLNGSSPSPEEEILVTLRVLRRNNQKEKKKKLLKAIKKATFKYETGMRKKS